MSELAVSPAPSLGLFGNQNGNSHGNGAVKEEVKILFNVSFNYNSYNFRFDNAPDISVKVEKEDDNYTFFRVVRQKNEERRIIDLLKELGLDIKNSKCTLTQASAVDWLSKHKEVLAKEKITLVPQFD